MKRISLLILIIGILSLSACAAPPAPPAPTTATPLEDPAARPQIIKTSEYYDKRGQYHLAGEIFNPSDYNLRSVQVVAIFYDETGTAFWTDFTFIPFYILSPGQTAPFDIWTITADNIQPASYRLGSSYHVTQDQPLAGLRIKSHSVRDDDSGYYNIEGEVENTSTMRAKFVKVVATYYDSAGDVIGTEFSDIDSVGAGDTKSFFVTSAPRKFKPASYKLQVQGFKRGVLKFQR